MDNDDLTHLDLLEVFHYVVGGLIRGTGTSARVLPLMRLSNPS